MENQENPNQETLEKWTKDTKKWIWGIFYYNKEDQRIFPPKKIEEMGITINFANPKSILALLVALSFFGMVVFFILHKK